MPVAAPGVEVISTSRTGGYEVKSGTSMAAPHVAGVAALMAAVAPNLPAAELRALLLQHAARADVPVSAGYVDALGAVLAASEATSYDAHPAAAGARAERDPQAAARPRPRSPCSARPRTSPA